MIIWGTARMIRSAVMAGIQGNGSRSTTVLTEAGPVDIDVPRDRDSSFEPVIVGKRQRRLSGRDDLVIS